MARPDVHGLSPAFVLEFHIAFVDCGARFVPVSDPQRGVVGELERLRKGALARAQLVHLRLRRSSSRTDGAQYIDESGGVSSLLVIHVELEGGVDAEPRFASVSACDVDVVEAILWVFVFKSLVQRLFVNFLLSTGS
jgi:hypothetical protein